MTSEEIVRNIPKLQLLKEKLRRKKRKLALIREKGKRIETSITKLSVLIEAVENVSEVYKRVPLYMQGDLSKREFLRIHGDVCTEKNAVLWVNVRSDMKGCFGVELRDGHEFRIFINSRLSVKKAMRIAREWVALGRKPRKCQIEGNGRNEGNR